MKTKAKSVTTKTDTLEVGTGVLTWFRAERQTDRYGSVWLTIDGTEAPAPLTFPPVGQRGRLYAEVIEGRQSNHIGDLFRGLRQREIPKAGLRVELGRGVSFKEPTDGIPAIGVMPMKQRHDDWLNPRELYHLHNCLVRLIWEPGL